ncbi:MFS transporter [Denitrobaculum tricleocarpae]|uniref:MFS transporter n=1 Tax=Denitrobaculum tricleocarpae TaxID=2591009 RepID=A0A545TQS3_9PROT|nr:MFS transporter [Denitrobaculum tricleocarpae]TQV79570.1 MFS transporter [Denitrobaculum tricleocarpae]
MSPVGLIAVFVVSLVLVMLSNASFPALIPTFQAEWRLSNTEAGWISGIYYAGYAAAVPFLVSLTDREDARSIYLYSTALSAISALAFALWAEGFWTAMALRALAGVSLAGTYMVGLKILTDRISGRLQSRAISLYTAHFAIGNSLSVLMAGEVTLLAGWSWAFGAAAAGSVIAFLLVFLTVGPSAQPRGQQKLRDILDVRPVVRNRPAFGYILGYAAHIWELFGFRNWIVVFLAFSISLQPDQTWGFNATQVATVVLLLGLPASVIGNELSLRFGRRRVITVIMLCSAALACTLGFTAALPFGFVVLLCGLYGLTVTGESASLTTGVIQNAEGSRKGATMALQSLLGFGVGAIAPLAFGVVLDLAGGTGEILAWGLAFGLLGLGAALGPLVLLRLTRQAPSPA